jgi:Icc-related predicted phosphoesterase
MPKLTFISDTHNKHDAFSLKPTDFLIHTGDLTSKGTLPEVAAFLYWFNNQPAKHKVFIAGNHDWLFYESQFQAKMLLRDYPEITYLEDSGIELEGIKFYGSPYQPVFYNWAFNANEETLKKKWHEIPDATDILLTHGPAHGIMDLTYSKENVGCKSLKYHIMNRVKPKIFAFGHIHEGYGTYKFEDTLYINACSLDRRYRPCNEPIVMEI